MTVPNGAPQSDVEMAAVAAKSMHANGNGYHPNGNGVEANGQHAKPGAIVPMDHSSQAREFIDFHRRLRSVWTDCPNVSITFKDLAYTIPLPIHDHGVPNVAKALFFGLKNKFIKPKMHNFAAVAPCSGVIKPSTMTLVLAPPGHGKSTLLRALAGRLQGDKKLSGSVRYNGWSMQEARKAGVGLESLCTYVGQNDLHFPTLTVRETLDFAAKNSVPDPTILGDATLTEMDARRADMVISMLGLDECKDTILGDAMLRGVSGGQKRRATLGELLVTNSRVLCLDEVSTGLDAAVTLHVFEALQQWTQVSQGTVVTALLQPTPETYSLFDDLILMRDGHVLYHGPRSEVRRWVTDVVGLPFPESQMVDEAGFLVDLLVDPVQIHRQCLDGVGYYDSSVHLSSKTLRLETAALVQAFQQSPAQLGVQKAIEAVESNPAIKATLDTKNWSAYSKAQFGTSSARSTFEHLKLNLQRQAKLVRRNKTMIRPRVFQAIWNGFVYGTLFYNLDASEFANRLGLVLLYVMSGAFSNMAELPIAEEARNVVSKQREAHFYPITPYMTSVLLLHAPLVVMECLIFGTFLYWLPGFSANAGRFFFFCFVYFANSMALSTFFRSISYSARNADVARQMDFPFIIIFVCFGGFLLTYNKIPNWLIWVFWLDPLSWATRSLAQNEFFDSRYDGMLPTGFGGVERAGDAYLGAFGIDTHAVYQWMGIVYLLGFFLAFGVLSTCCLGRVPAPRPMGTKRHHVHQAADVAIANGSNNGTDALAAPSPAIGAPAALPAPSTAARAAHVAAVTAASEPGAVPVNVAASSVSRSGVTVDVDDSSDSDDVEDSFPVHAPVPASVGGLSNNANTVSNAITLAVPASRAAASSVSHSSLPFVPSTLAWKGITYTVYVPPVGGQKKKSKKQLVPKVLLTDVAGFARPGTLTALMGASGAGKTTLLDLIAGRKTVGKIEGQIFVNGVPVDLHSKEYTRVVGYVEQQDLHNATSTVRECLDFSAKLRLSTSVTAEQRDKFVTEVMDLVGLSRIGDRIIGSEALPGLAPGQLKLVTVAVELVANPAILYLDEPTSGLDAPSAHRVMKAVRRIAATGRSVVCTIHQPSAELFLMFDRMLLLQPGGKEVFFGDLGTKSSILVQYLEMVGAPMGAKLPSGINPANWMLDVINPPSADHSAVAAAPAQGTGTVVVNVGTVAPTRVDFAAEWRRSELYQLAVREVAECCQMTSANTLAASTAQYVNMPTRYWELQKRYMRSHWRNAPMNLTRFALELMCGLLFGLIYFNSNFSDFAGVNNILAVVFLSMAFPGAMGANAVLPILFRERAVYYREKSSGMYGYGAYHLALTIVEIPFIIVALFIFFIPFFFLIGFPLSAAFFFRFYLSVFLMAMFYNSMGMLFLAMLPNTIVANIVNGLFMSMFFIFGGTFIRPSAMPPGWHWFFYVDPVPKAFFSVALPLLQCEGAGCPTIVIPGVGVVDRYQYFSNQLESSADDAWHHIGWLVFTIAIVRSFAILAGYRISHIKR